MTQAVHREVPKTDKCTNRRLAFGVFAAPVVWFVHEVVGVSILARECEQNAGVATWQWIVLAVLPVLAAAFAPAGIIGSYRVFRHNTQAKITEVEGWTRVEFVAVFGVFFSSFLLLNIIYFGVMPFVVEPCVRII